MRKLLMIMSIVPLLLVAACGSSEPSENDAKGDGELKTVRVGFLPITNDAPLYLAVKKGYFKKHGLDVKLTAATNFGAGLAAVINGESQFSFGASVPIMIARSKGAPIRLVAGQESMPSPFDKASSPDGVFVKKGSIVDASDLAGKTIALNALGNINQLAIQEAVQEAGADPKKIKFIEMAYPDMVNAVKSGKVDGAALVEPFTTVAKAGGLVPVEGAYWVDGLPDKALIDGYIASEKTVKSDPDMVKSWVTALREATEYAQAHPDEVRKFVSEFTKLDAATTAKLNFYDYSTEISTAQITNLSDLMERQGFIEKNVDPNKFLH